MSNSLEGSNITIFDCLGQEVKYDILSYQYAMIMSLGIQPYQPFTNSAS